jgi:hypothetical protein
MDAKQEEAAKELVRQLEEARKIGRLIRTVITDMCRSRNVSNMTMSRELTAHSLSMLRSFHKDVYDSVIEEHGTDGYLPFEDSFPKIAMKHFLDTGDKIKKDDSPPSNFDILSGDHLTNINLAKCLLLKEEVSIDSQSETGFSASQAGDYFEIRVSVYKDIISFFYYIDEPWDSIEDAAMDCARYNSNTNIVKAHIVKEDNPQIHFTYIYPHNGSVNVTDIKNIILRFIEEDKKTTVWRGEPKG